MCVEGVLPLVLRVVCVGGDGMFSEVLHGLVSGTQADHGVDQDRPDARLVPCSLRIGIIPAGRGHHGNREAGNMSGRANDNNYATFDLYFILARMKVTIVSQSHSKNTVLHVVVVVVVVAIVEAAVVVVVVLLLAIVFIDIVVVEVAVAAVAVEVVVGVVVAKAVEVR